MPEAEGVVEFVIRDVTLDGKPFVMPVFGNDHRMRYWPFVHPVSANGVRCLVVDARLEELEPMAYRFPMSVAQDNELQVRDGRIAERTTLAELQGVGDTV